jgi:uncharacterized protein YqhQ
VAEQPSFASGGQAVIEGVMIRGRNHFSLAVRRQDGSITHTQQPLNALLTGRIRRVPLIRGGAVLIETLVLGVKALHQSANMAMLDQKVESDGEMSGWAMGVTLGVSLTLGIGIFFILPLLLVRIIDSSVTSDLLSNVIEGLLRLVILVGYIGGIGLIKDIRRVYAYHGAEHMAVHAHEAGLPLNLANVRKFGTPHPRCGTAFLLTVVLVSIVVFAFLGRPDFEWRILSRIALLPVVAGVSNEIIRFSGAHQTRIIAPARAVPGLLLQSLTPRQPDDAQIEVAITAMEAAIAADAGVPYVASLPRRDTDGEPSSPVESNSP